jgi:hypothetical protein
MKELEHEGGVFSANVADWRKTRIGRFVVIRGDEVAGFFDSLPEAFAAGTKKYGLEPFLVRQVLPESPVNVSFLGSQLLVR